MTQSSTKMNIEYRSHYFDDPEAKASFERYARTVFKLDFSRWKARGLWDEQYTPFSAFVDNECVASICVYPSEMTVNGEKRKWAQLLTVGTLPEYRGRGIQYEIWKRARRWIEEYCVAVFLFTDESAAGFYPKLGLERRLERYDVINPSGRAAIEKPRFRKLDVDDDTDFAILQRLANEREPISGRLGFKNPDLLLFMILYLFRDWSYYLEDMDAVVIVEESPERLRIHDIISRQMPSFADLENFLGHFQKDEIEFLFCTDKFKLRHTEKREVKDELLFVSSNFELDGDFVFPSSIRA